MKDYYKIMGLTRSASQDKIRRAYRILARRYHPDVNPGQASSEKFKDIAEAYNVLKNAERRKKYDREYAAFQYRHVDARVKAYHAAEQQEQKRRAEKYYTEQKRDYESIKKWQDTVREGAAGLEAAIGAPRRMWRAARGLLSRLPAGATEATEIRELSVLEVSISLKEAILGAVRTIKIDAGGSQRTLKVKIPAGVRNGSVVRLKPKSRSREEVLCILKVERHSSLAIEAEGLVIDVPVTVHEAIAGATISVPTFEEPAIVKIQPNTQSGSKLRVKGKGLPGAEGRGDLFVRVMVHVPESELAVGIKEKSAELDQYYENPVRHNLAKTLGEMLE